MARRAFGLCAGRTTAAVSPADDGSGDPKTAALIANTASYHSNEGKVEMTDMQTPGNAAFVEDMTHKYFALRRSKNAVVVAQQAITNLIHFTNRELQERLKNLEFGVKQAADNTRPYNEDIHMVGRIKA